MPLRWNACGTFRRAQLQKPIGPGQDPGKNILPQFYKKSTKKEIKNENGYNQKKREKNGIEIYNE